MCLGTLVQDGLAHMWGIIWRSAPAKFKTGMCEMKILGLRFCGVSWDIGSRLAHMRGIVWRAAPESWDIGSGWVGTHVGYNMEICSGKVQNRDV